MVYVATIAPISPAEFGKAKVDKTKPKVNLAVAENQKETRLLIMRCTQVALRMTECEHMQQCMKLGFSLIADST